MSSQISVFIEKGTRVWKPEWMERDDGNGSLISSWCQPPTDPSSGQIFCRACSKQVMFASHGLNGITKHAATATHITKMRALTSTQTILPFFKSSSNDQRAGGKEQSLNRKATAAEAIWSLHMVEQNYSFLSSNHVVEMFCKMFPDSTVPMSMALKESKLTYLITDGIYPHVVDILKDELLDNPFSLEVDEANKGNHSCLAIVVRYMPKDSWTIRVLCMDLPRLACSDSKTIASSISDSVRVRVGQTENMLCVMSDSCNTMRGSKSGVIKRLKDGDFPHLVDAGGCSLHYIHNTCRYGIDAFDTDVERLLSDIYVHFTFSNEEAARYSQLATFMEVTPRRFLRHIQTRWLQILPVVERVLEQLAPLTSFFQQAAHRAQRDATLTRASNIRDTLLNPVTKCDLLFIQTSLKGIAQFELTFQRESTQIHLLWRSLKDLVSKWFLRFLRSTALAKPVWETVVEGNWLPESELIVGVLTREALTQLTPRQVGDFYRRVKLFFSTTTRQLLKYLPLQNKFLWSAQLLLPSFCSNPQFAKCVQTAAENLPTVITTRNLDELAIEARQYALQFSSCTEQSTADDDILQHWSIVTNKQFPLMRSLVRALLTIPHANSDAERVFSVLSDISTDKRNSLGGHTTQALVVIRTFLRGHNYCCHSFPVTDGFLKRLTNAHQEYEKRKTEKREEKQKRKREENERSLRQALDREVAASSHMKTVKVAEETAAAKRLELEAQRERARELRAQADKVLMEAEEGLSSVAQEEKNISQQKEREKNRLLNKVIISSASLKSYSSDKPAAKRFKVLIDSSDSDDSTRE